MTSTPDAVAFDVPDESGLAPIAAAFAAALPEQAVVALHGDLGAGKTTFVKAVAAAAGIDPREVISPTFGLIHEHRGTRAGRSVRLVHADLYRLAGLDELREIGWDDAIAARPDVAVWAFVEWPERIGGALPDDRLDVTLGIVSETARTLVFSSTGPVHGGVLGRLRDERSLSSLRHPRGS